LGEIDPGLGYAGFVMYRLPFLSLFLLFGLVTGSAQSRTPTSRFAGDPPPSGYSKVFVLWPEGAPLAKGTGPTDVPKLYYYPAVGSGVGSSVIVLPGGGYNHVVMEKEGAIEAKWLAAHGVAAFVLQYRLSPAYRYPSPMLDGSRAVRYVRSHAAGFDIEPNKIGVWGFSAGGHLAGFLATAPDVRDKKNPDPVERVSGHPDFSILSYARLSMEASVPRTGNMESLLGQKPTPEMVDMISIVRHVTKETAPAFIYSTSADQTVNSMNATAYYDALKRAGVPVELHIFELGPHGTGMGQNLKGLAELEVWPTLLDHWMQLHDWMPMSLLDR
jgi:acetyl esterase/lipase